ncbi:hypothetical protein BJ508DRAFT_365947 [Ascobolus immersus RN42]|uniref:Uncharacterized protein n=1 Tax=Ascobolus immersus RN42 TaxID=1160509 RepID=A0A3N4HNR9_ASCIM|nr:hypothetical protein BJ508DRAFT_365947 [Ascobolus immersus RN42]
MKFLSLLINLGLSASSLVSAAAIPENLQDPSAIEAAGFPSYTGGAVSYATATPVLDPEAALAEIEAGNQTSHLGKRVVTFRVYACMDANWRTDCNWVNTLISSLRFHLAKISQFSWTDAPCARINPIFHNRISSIKPDFGFNCAFWTGPGTECNGQYPLLAKPPGYSDLNQLLPVAGCTVGCSVPQQNFNDRINSFFCWTV